MSTPIRPGFILGMLASIVLSPCAVAAPAPVVPAAGETREAIRDVLRGDARLDLKVNLAQKNQPLGEILAALGLQLQIPLAASRDTADDKVTVFLDQRPAAEVLMLLARHLDFRWYRRGDGYELGQSVASKQREAALSEQERKEQWAAISAQMERAARLAVIPRERLEARREAIRVQLQSRDLATEEYVRLTVEAETLHAVLYGEWGPAVAIYRSLTPRQVQELLGGREIRLSSADLTLPPAVAALVRQAQRVAARPTALSYGIPPDEALPPGDATAVIRLFDPLSTPVGLRPPVSSLQLEFLLPYSAGWEAALVRMHRVFG